jgi:exosortase D (VPLPA-CTERM-specific)
MTAVPVRMQWPRHLEIVLVAAALILAVTMAFGDALLEAAKRWREQEEYSHGFLIPAVTAWVLWTRRNALAASIGPPSWIGLAAVLLATLLHVVGGLGAIFLLSQVGMILALLGIVLCIGGVTLLRVTFIPLAFLIFAIPLPYFLDSELSWRLQLLSSELGVVFMRALQIPVFLEGNVIDLGSYKLQVVEACSGLRYLYPLLCMGFLVAWVFQAPLWQRAVVFLSAIPITIMMNSARLVLVAVLVDRWGVGQAEGLLHWFEGWVIFLACAGLLFIEASLLTWLGSRKPFRLVFGPPQVEVPARPRGVPAKLHPYVLVCLLLLGLAGLAGHLISDRQEIIPERVSFATFPASIGAWHGRPSSLEPQVEHFLGLTDYIISDYSRSDGRAVNLYVAYYASQRNGVSPHSPQVCLPGNGWQIAQFERTSYRTPDGDSLPLNRAVIERDSEKQVVYYWFEQRGRRVANEYISKWYLLKDAIYLNRTDGALVRLSTALYPGEDERDADERLRAFTRVSLPRLTKFLPRAPVQMANATNASAQQP